MGKENPTEGVSQGMGFWGYQGKTLEEYLIHDPVWLALQEKSFEDILPIQKCAMPLIFHRKDLLVRAASGSGKTHAYLIAILDRKFAHRYRNVFDTTKLFILAPTSTCKHVHQVLESLTRFTHKEPRVTILTSSNDSVAKLDVETPEIIISTPDSLKLFLEKEYIRIQDKAILVIDDMDELLKCGYKSDLELILDKVPQYCECLVFTADRRSDARWLNSIVRRNPYILTLQDDGVVKVEIIPYNAEQLYILCHEVWEKLAHLCVFLGRTNKVLIFTNSALTSRRLKWFIENYTVRSAVLDTDLSHSSRLSIEDGDTFDCLIATDDGLLKQKEIHLEDFDIVLNFDVPRTVVDYTLRTDHRRAKKFGDCYFLIHPEERHGVFKDFKTVIGGDDIERSEVILPDLESRGNASFYSDLREVVNELSDVLPVESHNCDEKGATSEGPVEIAPDITVSSYLPMKRPRTDD